VIGVVVDEQHVFCLHVAVDGTPIARENVDPKCGQTELLQHHRAALGVEH